MLGLILIILLAYFTLKIGLKLLFWVFMIGITLFLFKLGVILAIGFITLWIAISIIANFVKWSLI